MATLTASEIASAIKWNRYHSAKLGWKKHFAGIVGVLKLPPSVAEDRFAQGVADWQEPRKHVLEVDGIIGPQTWKKLKPEVLAKPATVKPTPLPSRGPLWLGYAYQQMMRWASEMATWIGTSKDWSKAEAHLDWDEHYFMASPYYGGKRHRDGEIPKTKNLHWCAAFVNWCLHRSGHSHTGSASEASFLKSSRWRFDALREPRPGCVVVVGDTTPHHVAFLATSFGLPSDPGKDVNYKKDWYRIPLILGGNQSNTINIKSAPYTTMFAARGQNGITSPYLWPLRGASTCGISSVPSDGPHFCGLNPAAA